MRLERAASFDTLTRRTAAVLDRRLRAQASPPIAVALSGGGDSLALLALAQAWARPRGRPVLALSVDHGLQSQSPAWIDACQAAAHRLGAGFRALAWTGPKPEHGLPAAARAARHRLVAEAARQAGARVVLFGHTADDVLEARAMRAAGSTTPSPHEWAPSPAWPEGRGLFLLRPLLDARRAELRAWLDAQGLDWIEDPANADLRFARARARANLADGSATEAAPGEPRGLAAAAALALSCTEPGPGALAVGREVLRIGPAEARCAFVAGAAVCSGGGSRLPRGARLSRLAALLAGEETVTATLAGTRVEADAREVRFVRERGEAARGGLAPCDLPAGSAIVWDGRFEICSGRPGLSVRRLAGYASRLSAAERRRLADIPGAARGALPVLLDEAGAVVGSPALGEIPGVLMRAWPRDRLLAACGVIEREPG